jgi:hypothetical protein
MVDRMFFMKSVLKPAGSVYSILATFGFGRSV